MVSVPSSVNSRRVTAAVGDSDASAISSFLKEISIGDCALFKPQQQSPPFIGVIHSLGSDKETLLQLGVTWLYRPADIQLPKGVAIEAAPNEVFYSFHRDEIPAASLLHPCKVAFLPKGVELPPGVSSFVCRRVYDTTNKRLWWLTDKDFINGRREEVDQLLHKSQLEMHATVQQHGGRSPKPVNSPTSTSTSTSQLKHSPDSVQNSTSAFHSQSKGKKRERNDQGSELVKREYSSKVNDGESSDMSPELLLKSEIAKLTENGSLVDSKAVERLVQLMHSDKAETRIDIPCRSLLAGVIAATDKDDCLNRFVELRGLTIMDEWLREVHKGKIGDSNNPRDHDKLVVDFLRTLLRALERLPVNLNALQMCNIGKSVNLLRSHRNSEIHKKARSLVDTWKKRVQAEMSGNDSRSATSQGVSWPARVRNEVSCGVTRHSSASDAVMKNSPLHISSSKSAPAKSIQGEVAKCASASQAIVKLPSAVTSTSANMRDGNLNTSVFSGSVELPLSAAKDEKSSTSSQSQTNSHCSSDNVKNLGLAVKEDARSSNSGSASLNKSTGSASRHRTAANGLNSVAASTVHREGGSLKHSSLTRISASEKFSQPPSCEKACDIPVADSNNHKLIVKISNRGRTPSQNVNGGCLEDPSSMNSRASSPVIPDKLGQSECNSKEKTDGYRNSSVLDMSTKSWQINELKDVATACDEADGLPSSASDSGHCPTGGEAGNLTDAQKTGSGPKSELHDSSLSSINALIESCVKYSESKLPMSAGDVIGMNLLASVAAGEISKSTAPSPVCSPQRSTSVAEGFCSEYSVRSKLNGDIEVSLGEPNQSKASADVEGQIQKNSLGVSEDEQKGGKHLLPNGDSCFRSGGKLNGSGTVPSAHPTRVASSEGSDQGHESKPPIKNDIRVCTPHDTASFSATENKIGDDSLKKENLERSAEEVPVSSANVAEMNDLTEGRESKGVINKWSPAKDMKSVGRAEKVGVSSCVNDLLPGQFTDLKDDVDHSIKSYEEDGSFDQNIKGNEEDLVDKDTPVAHTSKKNSYSLAQNKELDFYSKDSKLPAREGDDAEGENRSGTKPSSPSMGSSFTDGKLEFDLNEGFDVDDSKDGDLPSTVADGRLNCQLPSCSVASTSVGLPASVTVAAAAKGPFLPPEDLLRNRGELGWRGSAATSAFRPAEPRKVSEISPCANKEHISDPNNEKQGRARLEFDLNVADERIMEDMECQINDFQTSKKDLFETNNRPTGVASRRNGGALDLDLNRVDEALDLGQPLPSVHRFDMPLHTIRLSSSSAPSNSDSGRRDFDLNNGPSADEATVDSQSINTHLPLNIYTQPSVGLQVNCTEMGTLNPWYNNAGTPFSAIPIPAGLPDRVQPFPMSGTPGGPPRMWAVPAGPMTFNPDMYRGPVLSSPAVPFPSAQFQYPAFPFGTSLPLASSSLPGGSTAFMDLSSGGRLCIPAVGSQLVGSAVNVPSQYPRPYVVGLSDVSNTVTVDNAQKWGRQGLDLNAGPDVEGRDETLRSLSRPMSNMGPLALTNDQSSLYSMEGGVLKRKEPDGGWDPERLSFKQRSWQG
ncbi:uncharacterized protein LOC141652645 isoform X2 [Silene latifolia]|uniref:uncharacterized protein LOC141652645 isoform X2 n=1 Tax=Silene latifolia TaxID=37657 RepID=UPI003D7783D2